MYTSALHRNEIARIFLWPSSSVKIPSSSFYGPIQMILKVHFISHDIHRNVSLEKLVSIIIFEHSIMLNCNSEVQFLHSSVQVVHIGIFFAMVMASAAAKHCTSYIHNNNKQFSTSGRKSPTTQQLADGVVVSSRGAITVPPVWTGMCECALRKQFEVKEGPRYCLFCMHFLVNWKNKTVCWS